MAWNKANRALILAVLSYPAWDSTSLPSASAQNALLDEYSAAGQAQQTKEDQGAPNVRERIRVQSNLVVLSITVSDSNGKPVSGLRQEDFHVFDDGVEQKIIAFSDEGLPLSMVILVDSDMKWKEGTEMTKSLGAIAGGLSDTDEAMVCRYDMLFYPGKEFTRVGGSLIADLKSAQVAAKPDPPYIPQPLVTDRSSTTGPPSAAAPTYAGSRPSKALDDALHSAAELLENRGKDRRKVILIVSDGVNEPKLNHHSHENVIEKLLRNNVSVYSLGVGTPRAKHKFSSLSDYTSETGGAIFYANNSVAMEILYARITEQARHDYTVAYAPTGNNKDESYHVLKVTTRTGLTASTRKGYYSGDSEAPQGKQEN